LWFTALETKGSKNEDFILGGNLWYGPVGLSVMATQAAVTFDNAWTRRAHEKRKTPNVLRSPVGRMNG
jgi:hypothetical protein